MEGALCRSPWLVDGESIRFQVVLKRQNKVRNENFWRNVSINIFKLSSILDKINAWWWNLFNLLDFTKRFILYKKREKTLTQQSMTIEKLGKVGLCFIKVCFIEPFKMIIIFSSIGLFVDKIFICFAFSFTAQFLLFHLRMTYDYKEEKVVTANLWECKLQHLFEN